MPPSSKRRNRRRAVEPQDLSDVDLPDSSPSRPAAKKRRVCSSPRSSCHQSLSACWAMLNVGNPDNRSYNTDSSDQ